MAVAAALCALALVPVAALGATGHIAVPGWMAQMMGAAPPAARQMTHSPAARRMMADPVMQRMMRSQASRRPPALG